MLLKVSIPNRFQLKVVPTFRNVVKGTQGEIHYIGGSDVLPMPLEAEKEAEMIE